MPGLWPADEITVKDVENYFNGSRIVQVDRGGYQEPMRIPKSRPTGFGEGTNRCVEAGIFVVAFRPCEHMGRADTAGVLNASAKLVCAPLSGQCRRDPS